MNSISYHIEDVIVPDIDPEFLRLWVSHIVNDKCKEVGDINYIFCSDDYLLDINKQYLAHDYYTDIVTFDYSEGSRISGDLFISIDRVKDNAKLHNSGNDLEELQRVMIHGVLHLLGYNDQSEEEQKEMTKMEDWALELRRRFT